MEAPTLAARPVADCMSEEVANAMNRGFEGYFVPLSFTAQAYERRFRSEHLDPYASRVYSQDGSPAGALLIARRGWTRGRGLSSGRCGWNYEATPRTDRVRCS
jgi:hypothetical protein